MVAFNVIDKFFRGNIIKDVKMYDGVPNYQKFFNLMKAV